MIAGNHRITLIELLMPMEMILWALWFAAFNSIQSSPSYDYGKFFSSLTWALIFSAASGFQLAAIFHFRRLRIYAALLNMVIWVTWLFIFVLSNYKSHAVPICIFAAYQNALNFEAIRGNAQK